MLIQIAIVIVNMGHPKTISHHADGIADLIGLQIGMTEIKADTANFLAESFIKTVGDLDKFLKTRRHILEHRGIFIPGLTDTVFNGNADTQLRTAFHIRIKIGHVPLRRSLGQIMLVFIHHGAGMDHIIRHTAFGGGFQPHHHFGFPLFPIGTVEQKRIMHRGMSIAGRNTVVQKPFGKPILIKILGEEFLNLGKTEIRTGDLRFFQYIQKSKVVIQMVAFAHTANHGRVTHRLPQSFSK